jgi:4-hydroxy-tetrahydrodipicolinate synthase
MLETAVASKMEGSFVALITPFNEDGSIDFGAIDTLLQWHEANGTSSILFMGTTGEASVLSAEERREIVVRTAKMKHTARMPFFYGCTGNCTDTTIANVRFAADNGADGALIAVPPYTCPPESDAERYFLDVADATDLPLGTYNNAPRLRTDLQVETLLRIFRHPNYIVHKESTARVNQVAELLRAAPDVSIMCDDSPEPGLAVQTMALGGQGISNGAGNIAPAELGIISRPWHDHKQIDAFRAEYLRILPLLSFVYSTTSPIPLKSLMSAVGLPAGSLRRPLRRLEAKELQRGLAIARGLGLDKRYALDF